MSNSLKYAFGAVASAFALAALVNIHTIPFGLSKPVELGLTIALAVAMAIGLVVAGKAGIAEHRRIGLRKRVDRWVENGGREQLEAAQAEAKKTGLLLRASLEPDLETLDKPYDDIRRH